MASRLFAPLALVAAIAALPACSDNAEPEAPAVGDSDPLAGLGIEAVKASAVTEVPLGTVPGTITLPPEARVAVTAPFPGAAVRVYVIEGQPVRRGQPLALVRSAEPVQISGDLSRARSEAGLAEARANRLTQLADEGIIAQARADEAKAALAQARASVAEQRRLASLGGVGPDGMMTLRAPIEAAGAYQIELQLPERLAKQVRPGMSVEIDLAGEGGEPNPVGGQILAVSPSIDPATRAVLARASIGGAPGIVAGRNVSVTIMGTATDGGIAVPASAVTRIGGADHVFVRQGKTYVPRKVTVLASTGEQAVISDGLSAGDVVAASSIAELKAMNAE